MGIVLNSIMQTPLSLGHAVFLLFYMDELAARTGERADEL